MASGSAPGQHFLLIFLLKTFITSNVYIRTSTKYILFREYLVRVGKV